MAREAARDIGPYELLALLGQGGMGAVWRARHREAGLLRALKLLPGGRVDPTRLSRFAREGQHLARVQHENVVRVHEAGADGGRPYLVMDLVEGQPLAALLQGPRLPLPRALALALGIARGVAALHAAGIVHRDLKPENVLVRDDGAPVVVDLGLALAPDLDERLTRSHALVGTPMAMAPEQLRSQPVAPTADVWALGLLLFHLVAGRPALPAVDSFPALVQEVLHHDRPRLGSVDPGLPAELDALCARLLARDPARRPADARPVAAALEALLLRLRSGELPTAGAARGRRRALAGVGLALALAGLAVAGRALDAGPAPAPVPSPPAAVASRAARPPQARPARPQQERRRTDAPLLTAQVRGDVSSLWFLDDARLAVVCERSIVVLDAATGAELKRRDDVGRPATRLPGGGLLAAHRGRVRRLTDDLADAGDLLRLEDQVTVVSVSADGRTAILGEHRGGGANVLDLASGRAVTRLAGHAHGVWTVALSADGALAFTGTGAGPDNPGPFDDALRVWRLPDGTLLRREETVGPTNALAVRPGTGEVLVGTSLGRLYAVAPDAAGARWELVGKDASIIRDPAGLLGTPLAHSGSVSDLAFSHGGRRLWSVSRADAPARSELRGWDLVERRELFAVRDRAPKLAGVDVSPDGTRLAFGDDGGAVQVWAVD